MNSRIGKHELPAALSGSDESDMVAVGIYDSSVDASARVKQLIDSGIAKERISVLTRTDEIGSEILKPTAPARGHRLKSRAKQGALWGSLVGLLAGMADLVTVPGLGSLIAAGEIAGPLAGVLAGATGGAGGLVGAAMLSDLIGAIRHVGVPDAEVQQVRAALEAGRPVIIVRCSPDTSSKCVAQLGHGSITDVFLTTARRSYH